MENCQHFEKQISPSLNVGRALTLNQPSSVREASWPTGNRASSNGRANRYPSHRSMGLARTFPDTSTWHSKAAELGSLPACPRGLPGLSAWQTRGKSLASWGIEPFFDTHAFRGGGGGGGEPAKSKLAGKLAKGGRGR